MNDKSITYVTNTNQPFDIEVKGKGQGVTRMSHARTLERYTEELIARYGTSEYDVFGLHLSDIPQSEQSELLRLFLESIDREMESEAIHGDDFSIDNDYTCALLALLQDDNFETRENLAYITRCNIIKYYSKSLQEILDSACEDFTRNMHEENNIRLQWDNNHGDYHYTGGSY